MDGDGAAVLTAVAPLGAGRSVAAEERDGQHRQQREDRAERAEELAEEPLLERHAHHNGGQRPERDARDPLERPRAQAGEGAPRRERRDDRPQPGEAKPRDGAENNVLHQLQRAARCHRDPLAAKAEDVAQRRGKRIDRVAQRAERARVAAEETPEHARVRKQGEKQRDEARQLERGRGAELLADVAHSREGGAPHAGKRHEERNLDNPAKRAVKKLRPPPLLCAALGRPQDAEVFLNAV